MNKKNERLNRLAADTIRMLAVDAVQKACSGHPGMPMGMADCATILWTNFLHFNPKDTHWINRDRFILSAGHGSMLLYALLHLAGYDLSLADLKEFRQWGSKTPGHPEFGQTPGVETTTGPLGQGFANGVGMAIAEKILSERFNTRDFEIIDHKIFGIVGDGDVMEGITGEAASIAGHLGLGNIVYIYDDNHISIEGNTNLTFSEDVQRRFEAYNWHTISIDGHCHDEIRRALEQGVQETERPTLILARTHIGYGSPNKQDSASSHGAPLGEEEVKKTKENLGWLSDQPFYIPDEVKTLFFNRVSELQKEYDRWSETFDLWKKNNPEQADLFEAMLSRKIPVHLEDRLVSVLNDKPAATRETGGELLQILAEKIPGLCGGSADLAPSTKTIIKNGNSIQKNNFDGRNLHFGVREHAMGAILNGMSLYGGLIPYGSTFLVFNDYMRPAIRLSALMKTQVIYIFTHDSIFVGEDGPTHQPVEHLAALRMIPNLVLFRPADGLETALSWTYAIRNQSGPTVICLSRQSLPQLDRGKNFAPKLIYKGGYVISKEEGDKPDLVLLATGSEVSLAFQVKELLQNGYKVRIVSMPSLELFLRQSKNYQQTVIPDANTPLVVIEAGIRTGWDVFMRFPMLFIGMNDFGASAPADVLAEKFGFTPKIIVTKIQKWIKEGGSV